MFLYNLVAPYLSVYTLELGASATQLGLVNSVGMATAGLVAPFIGWLIDRRGVRQVYLVGIALLAVSYLTYGVAGAWPVALLAMIAYWLGKGLSGQGCSTICGNSIRSEDRATAMSLCETLAAGVLGMLAPLVAAALVIRFGGVHIPGIRPLFFSPSPEPWEPSSSSTATSRIAAGPHLTRRRAACSPISGRSFTVERSWQDG